MVKNIGENSKIASYEIANLTTNEKNSILKRIAVELNKSRDDVKQANSIDMNNGKVAGLNEGLLDRLLIDDGRIDGMIESIHKVIDLKDPIGEMKHMEVMPNGLQIGQTRVPIGVVAIIYEARPNVTLDCSILCIKSSNSLILRGGKEAIETNKAIVKAIRHAIKVCGYNPDFVQLVEDTSRETATQLMKLKGIVDVLIPRGSKGLIDSVVENATVPVIETGTGNCHIYVDESADIEMAIKIIENAKTQRIGVCNAMESLLVHKNIEDEFYRKLMDIIERYNIKVYGCQISANKLKGIETASDEDYGKEYLDYAFSIKIVDDIDQAIDHIRKYSTHHSDVIVTNDYNNSQRFLKLVDSACVYVNASSRFTDGFEFGMGGEMGISTQKLHARGPVGLKELTSTKYVIYGQGQTR